MDRTLDVFTFELASKTPTPGGGGAAALCAALAAALGSMTANFTLGKKKYAEYDDEMRAIISECAVLRSRTLLLIKADAEAFEPLSRAYAIPKDEPGREAELEKRLLDAAAVPMELARLSHRIMELADILERHGSELMVSDAGCAAAIASAALDSAALNVLVNTRLMKNRGKAAEINAEVCKLLENKPQTYSRVLQRLS